MADQSIGMMEGAFFVPKGEILNWCNELLELNVTKIEQLGTGAVYCQILDCMFPGKIKINKVNWKAKNEWEFIQNFKILQQGFQKCNIKKHIEIEKLAKSRYQDNLEFMQWFKRFFEMNGGCKIENLDPKARRGQQANFSFVEYRENPKKREKQEQIRRGKSKSPLNKADGKPERKRELSLNNKYAKNTISKEQGVYYLSKLKEIEKVLNKDHKESQKLQKIQSILKDIHEEIEQELPNELEIEEMDYSLKEQNSIPSVEAFTKKLRTHK